MSEQLPRGWVNVRLRDAATVVDPNPKHRNPKYVPEGFPFVSTAEFLEPDGITLETRRRVAESTVVEQEERCSFTPQSVFFSRKGTIGKTRLHPGGRLALLDSLCVINPGASVEARFLLQALRSPQVIARIDDVVRGVALRQISVGEVRELEVPLPPLNEQRRIVEKLDALQARSRRAREALDAVSPLLEKLRQSILAAAFRGDLTKDWRAKNKNGEPASKLLERIRLERRRNWEESELAKMKAKGKPPTDDRWKAKYKEPEPVDRAGLPELPEGWCWASLDELVVEGPTNGFSPKSESEGTGTPTLKLSATTAGVCVLNASTTKRTSLPVGPDEPYWLNPGDLLIQRGNTLEYVGVSAIYEGPERAYIYPDLMMRVRACPMIGPRILWRALSWEFCRRFMRDRATGTAGNMPKVNGETVRSIPVPLPPIAEQAALLKAIDNALTAREVAASGVGELARKLLELERSVLAKAFRGELVPQDPNDEPAEAMLARTRGAANGGTTNGVTAKRTRGRGRALVDEVT